MDAKDLKERLAKSLFEDLDTLLPSNVKRKLTSSDIRLIIDHSVNWAHEHADAIALFRQPLVLHKPAASPFDRQPEDGPDFLTDLKKV